VCSSDLGKADAFDGLVSEFIALFGRSAPQWDRAESAAPLSTAPQLQVTRAGAFAWVSPSQLSDRALAALTGAVKRTAPPWRIDWRYVKAVEADVLPALGALFTQWADAPTRIQFLGGEHLLEVLAGQSTTGDKNADPAWWSVRLTLLRLMGEPDRFDQTALDYCVTYEISPPSWTPPKSNYTALAADGQPESAPADKAEELPPFVPTTVTGELLAATGVFKTALKGEIAQHATRALSALPQSLDRVQIIEFDCRALRRVDFAAAGEFLNWSLDQQSQGRTVTFRDVHRLLAAFFSVIGVNTAAQVVLRKD
ncbi:MAG: STAS domain-containing protein, partial [Burkholderiaceae bacterium]|jgi:ABC-type transporter Mla MlaB component|nr:STAS domain-containing protein [Burkholderiaceae bacterium]